ncbi:nucleotide-diphospho-sugar transferase [Cantharellus anzutake]|uniref:nucleotide-diphospho-sugar transferase n=1 Tax=Cantharellus anzutake TaxID=1750568 RepID=UPI0019039706|nr:nucleotide-diphospho-sugar transferase [Cantharellus anzutake]KAF8334178.1 nucleotide-diphospho-sugar transferase [Cantharellus anzutake]
MPPKASKDKIHASEQDEDILQAVILADSFNSRFQPLSMTKPRTLLPLCNIPLLNWTLEALIGSGVQQIFVFCCSHADLIKEAISQSRWSLPNSGVKITPIVTPEALSTGDVMRELDSKQIIASDFILISGDVVSTIPLQEVVREHRERRKVNKSCIMTMVWKPLGTRNRPLPGLDLPVLLLDAGTRECLHYEYVKEGEPRVALPREKMTGHRELEIRTDLVDCAIDVCSVDVPALFSENFDYQDLRTDFVHGVLTSDLLGKQIFCHIPKRGYAARVGDTRSYAEISRDVLSRRTFPLVPDDTPAYKLKHGFVYIGESVSLSRTCTLGSHSQVGHRSYVDDDAIIEGSVIGPGCHIGPYVKISNSFLMEGSSIGANSVVTQSIVACGVQIGPNSNIDRGCMIGDGAILGSGAQIPPFSKVSGTLPPQDDEWDEDGQDADQKLKVMTNPAILGQDAKAYIWPAHKVPRDELSDDSSEAETPTRTFHQLGYTTQIEYPESTASSTPASSVVSSPASHATSLDGDISNLKLSDSAEFRSECTQSLERAFVEGHTVENAAIELKTLRMASNVPLKSVKEVAISFLVSKISLSGAPAQQKQAVNETIERWGPLLPAIGGEDPIENILLLQDHCASSPSHLKLFGNVLAAFYNNDIVEDEDIKGWILDSRSKYEADSLGDVCRKQGLVLLKAIQAQSSDEDESD